MDAPNIENLLILTTGSRLYNKALHCYKKRAKIILAQESNELFQILSDNIGTTLLLDLSSFNGDVDHPTVKTIFKKGVQHRIIVVTNEQNQNELYKLLEQGARGFCQSRISDELLMKAIKTVNEGELWIERNMLSFVLSNQVLDRIKKRNGALEHMLSNSPLTLRELEIASYISHGKCNKIIARDLDISLSTVKKHLYCIFKKLQITHRIHLALIYSEIKMY